MRAETPLEILQLVERLKADFTSKLNVPDIGTPEDREKKFLSRALAAFAIQHLASRTADEAVATLVDGPGDGGIDAIDYTATSHRLWVLQAKYISTGRGEPELADVSKFRNGLENLLLGRFEAFAQNPAWERRLPEIRAHFGDTSLQVRAILVYSGIHLVSDDRVRLFEDLKQRVSPDSDYFTFQPYNLTSVHDWLTGADQGPGVQEVEITLLKPAWVREPYETLYGLVNLSDLAALAKIHGKQLLAANLRQYKGATEVNDRIIATIRDEPHHFFYLNNGLTAYCERVEVNNLDRGNADQKRLKAYGFSVVNGAQTLGSVDTVFSGNPTSPPQGFVFLKIISLERCVDDVAFAQRITRSTNFQNEIGSRDFAALDDQQERVALQLKLSGINYHYKDAEDTPEPDGENFTLDEATTAMACLEQENECDLCSPDTRK